MSILTDSTVSIDGGIPIKSLVLINRETIPTRASISHFDLDPPVTSKGLKDAFYTGKKLPYSFLFPIQPLGTVLREKNLPFHYCYSSPALRCIQTATKILEGLQLQNKIKIR